MLHCAFVAFLALLGALSSFFQPLAHAEAHNLLAAPQLSEVCEIPAQLVCQSGFDGLDAQGRYPALPLPKDPAWDFYLNKIKAQSGSSDSVEWGRAAFKDLMTPERARHLTRMADRVKLTYLKLIDRSAVLTKTEMRLAKSRIQSTYVVTQENQIKAPKNSYAFATQYLGDGAILIDPQTLFHLPNVNPHALMQVLAHEMAHSLNPCRTPEYYALLKSLDRTNPRDAELLDKLIAVPIASPHILETVKCMSEEAERLSTKGGPEDAWNQIFVGLPSQIEMGCSFGMEEIPACVADSRSLNSGMGVCSYTPNIGNQADEAFADFLAAEVIAQILNEDRPSPIEKTLLSIAAGYAGPECSKQFGSSLMHPTVKVRLNYIPYFSRRFNDATGCLSYRAERAFCPGIF